ncbi:lysophospholipid acyltransferase family protein [Streptomyces sp. NRRL F-5122]|uniref:lysophospholipid acyltransferase family protein n=1 Tax=Streptomyces sp. NRRL F-5122 TaxID=1609098 RepID=UPI001F42B94B|nr:lysophospholipid acyltransferase family protein [Streptomyces sp. NRRL F-5122]
MPSAPCTPRSCVDATASAASTPRAVLRLAAVLGVLIPGILVFPLVRRLPVASRGRIVRAWCRTLVQAAGVRVRLSGAAPQQGGLLMVANHISWLDIPLLAAVRPGRMLAKTEIRQWPVAGALTATSGALFIDRDRLRALPETVARIAGAMRAGSAVVVFPEGSTWCGRAQGRFRRAAFQAALDAGVPVQPVRLLYRFDEGTASTAPAFVGSDSLLTSVWRGDRPACHGRRRPAGPRAADGRAPASGGALLTHHHRAGADRPGPVTRALPRNGNPLVRAPFCALLRCTGVRIFTRYRRGCRLGRRTAR